MSNWIANSEIVGGMIMDKRISDNSVRPEIFHPSIVNLVKYYKSGITAPEELIERVGVATVQACLQASERINGIGECANWIQMLEQSAHNDDAANKMERFAKKLKRGETVDWSKFSNLVSKAQIGLSKDLIPLSDVERKRVPFVQTGWKPIDHHLGGLPEVGMILVGGNPGVGKTTWMLKLASKFVKKHPIKKVAIFSIEMVLSELSMRLDEVENLTNQQQERIILCEKPISPEEAINKASTIDDLGLMCTDFADLMIRGETTESSMAHIYRTYMIGAKQLRVPNVLLSQLNRNYTGGIPRPNHIRYTGLAEALAWMIIMLYNPNIDYFAEDKEKNRGYELQIVDECAYMICWKIRGGFREHPDDNPGAILTPFRGDKGWGEYTNRPEGKWFSLRKNS